MGSGCEIVWWDLGHWPSLTQAARSPLIWNSPSNGPYTTICNSTILNQGSLWPPICEVVPFWVENNLPFLREIWGLYILIQIAWLCQPPLALPMAVPMAAPTAVTWLITNTWLAVVTSHSPSPRYAYIRRKEENKTNIHAGFAACLTNTYAGFAAC